MLEDVDDAAVAASKKLIADGKIKVDLDSISPVLYIGVTVNTEHDVCRAELMGGHTNFCLIEKNGEVLLKKDYSESEAGLSPVANYSISEIYNYALNADIEELCFMAEAYKLNNELAQAGAAWERCTVSRSMIAKNGGFISSDERMSAKTLACAAAEARVLGMDKAAMSITGSGTHGIICTLPLDAYCKVKGLDDEKLLRATAMSYLVCMYIKEYSGKLSAFCGCGIAGGTGLACALVYLMGGDIKAVEAACGNMASSITGMICSGGNHCCCLKVISAVDSAFTAAELAVSGAAVQAPHGILDLCTEKTLQNLGLIADPGMVETERVILQIMQNKGEM